MALPTWRMSSIRRGSASLMVTAVVVWRDSTVTTPSFTPDLATSALISGVMSKMEMPGWAMGCVG